MEENKNLTVIKNGIEVSLPPLDTTTKLNMERCAEFLARMIQKYGKEVLAEIEAKENMDAQRTEC